SSPAGWQLRQRGCMKTLYAARKASRAPALSFWPAIPRPCCDSTAKNATATIAAAKQTRLSRLTGFSLMMMLQLCPETRNLKHQIRNKSKAQISKSEWNIFVCFDFRDFEIWICFEFWYSNFDFTGKAMMLLVAYLPADASRFL